MYGLGLTQDMLRQMSGAAQDHAIRLSYHVQEVREWWWWQRWLQPDEYKERVAALGTRLREVSQYLEHVEHDKTLSDLWDRALQVFISSGGDPTGGNK